MTNLPPDFMAILDIPTEESNQVQKSIDLDADLARWLDGEAKLLGISPSMLVGTLLEWARSEDITRDDDMMIFAQHGVAA